MNLYDFITFLHVAAAVTLLGSSVVVGPVLRGALRRARTTQEIRAFMSIKRSLLVVEPASALTLLASGIYLASAASFWSLGWVQVAVAIWVMNLALVVTTVKPVMSRIAAEASTAIDGPVGRELDRLRRAPGLVLAADTLMANDAAMLFLMIMKPGLTASLLVVGGAILAVTAVRAFEPRAAAGVAR